MFNPEPIQHTALLNNEMKNPHLVETMIVGVPATGKRIQTGGAGGDAARTVLIQRCNGQVPRINVDFMIQGIPILLTTQSYLTLRFTVRPNPVAVHAEIVAGTIPSSLEIDTSLWPKLNSMVIENARATFSNFGVESRNTNFLNYIRSLQTPPEVRDNQRNTFNDSILTTNLKPISLPGMGVGRTDATPYPVHTVSLKANGDQFWIEGSYEIRIPLQEILPIFQIPVLPLAQTNTSNIALSLTLLSPRHMFPICSSLRSAEGSLIVGDIADGRVADGRADEIANYNRLNEEYRRAVLDLNNGQNEVQALLTNLQSLSVRLNEARLALEVLVAQGAGEGGEDDHNAAIEAARNRVEQFEGQVAEAERQINERMDILNGLAERFEEAREALENAPVPQAGGIDGALPQVGFNPGNVNLRWMQGPDPNTLLAFDMTLWRIVGGLDNNSIRLSSSTFTEVDVDVDCWLNLKVLSDPMLNPLVEAYIRPFITPANEFRAMFSDVFTFTQGVPIAPGQSASFTFNPSQLFYNTTHVGIFLLEAVQGADLAVGDIFPGVSTFNVVKKFKNSDSAYLSGHLFSSAQLELDRFQIGLSSSSTPLFSEPLDSSGVRLATEDCFRKYRPSNMVGNIIQRGTRKQEGNSFYLFDLTHTEGAGYFIDADNMITVSGTLHNKSGNDMVCQVVLALFYQNSFTVLLELDGAVLIQQS